MERHIEDAKMIVKNKDAFSHSLVDIAHRVLKQHSGWKPQ